MLEKQGLDAVRVLQQQRERIMLLQLASQSDAIDQVTRDHLMKNSV